MSRHILDHGGPAQSPRAVRRFLTIEREKASGGLSRLLSQLDRTGKARSGAKARAFARIARGHSA